MTGHYNHGILGLDETPEYCTPSVCPDRTHYRPDEPLDPGPQPQTAAGRRLAEDYYAHNDARVGVGYSIRNRIAAIEEEARRTSDKPLK